MHLLMVGLLLVLVLDYSSSMWLKQYMENYHRPTYYNRRHSSKDHIDYNREALEQRDSERPKTAHRTFHQRKALEQRDSERPKTAHRTFHQRGALKQREAERPKTARRSFHQRGAFKQRNAAMSKTAHRTFHQRGALEQKDAAMPQTAQRTFHPFDPEKDLSYYVHILHRSSMICSGALISYRMVITSAQCFRSEVEDQLKLTVFKASDMGVVTGGEFAMSDPHPVINFFMPVEKNTTSVALLGLASKLNRNYYRHINIYNKVPNVGDKVKIAFLDPQNFQVKHMDTVILDKGQCQTYYTMTELFQFPIDETNYICVRNKRTTPRSACSTRPGDPLLVGNQLAGINMFGEYCSNEIGTVNMDFYLPMRPVIKFIQVATDSLRAFTHTGPYNASNSSTPSPLVQSLITMQPNFYVGPEFKAENVQLNDSEIQSVGNTEAQGAAQLNETEAQGDAQLNDTEAQDVAQLNETQVQSVPQHIETEIEIGAPHNDTETQGAAQLNDTETQNVDKPKIKN